MDVWSKVRLHVGSISRKFKNVYTETLACDQGGGIYVNGKSHPENAWKRGSTFKQIFLANKKNGDNKPVINLKKPNVFIAYL